MQKKLKKHVRLLIANEPNVIMLHWYSYIGLETRTGVIKGVNSIKNLKGMLFQSLPLPTTAFLSSLSYFTPFAFFPSSSHLLPRSGSLKSARRLEFPAKSNTKPQLKLNPVHFNRTKY